MRCALTFVYHGDTHVPSTVNPRYRLIGINIGVYLEYSNVKDGWFDHDVKLRVLPFNRYAVLCSSAAMCARRTDKYTRTRA